MNARRNLRCPLDLFLKLIAIVIATGFACFTSCALAQVVSGENPSTSPAEGGARLTGIVATDDGSPIEGAEVSLLRRGQYPGAPITRKFKTVSDGRFAFDAVTSGEYRIWALKGNLSSREKRLQGQIVTVSGTARQIEPITLKMHPGRMVIATIVSAINGKPVAGAFVHLPRTDTAPDFKTDAQGRVVVEGLTPEVWEIQAMAPGRARESKSVNLSDSTETEVDFAIVDGGALRGKVTDANGRALEGIGANIYLEKSGTPLDYVRTAADGSYQFDYLPLDHSFRMLFTDDAYVNAYETAALATANRQVEVNVKLSPKPPGGSIVGTVVDGNGNPLAGAEVTSYGSSSRDEKAAKSDANGVYRLDGIRPGQGEEAEIVARAAGWVPTGVRAEPGTKDAPTQLQIRMAKKGHQIIGRVVNDKGEPIKGVYIDAGMETAGDNRRSSTRTDEGGSFKFDSLPPGASFDFDVTGYTSIEWMELLLDRQSEVVVTMHELASISGKAVDADSGQPVAKFNLRTRAYGMLSQRIEQGDDFNNRDGTFKLVDLPADSKMPLIVKSEGYPVQYFDGIKPSPGGQGDPVLLQLSKSPPDHFRVAGRIVDTGGKPIADVEVRAISYLPADKDNPKELRFDWGELKSGQLAIQDDVRAIEQTRTKADGSFDFPSLKGPDVEIDYWGKSVPQTRLEDMRSRPPEQREHLNIEVPAPATVHGKIDRTGFPSITKLTLRSKTDFQQVIELRLKEGAETYDFSAVPAGSYTLQISGKPIPNADGTFQFEKLGTKNVEVGEGEALQLDLGTN